MYWKMTFWKTAEITLENMFKNRLNQLWKYSLQFIWGTTLENRRVFLRLYHYIPLCTMGFLQPKIRQTEETMYWKMIFWKTVQITLENIFKTRLNQLWKYSLQVIWGTTHWEQKSIPETISLHIPMCNGGPSNQNLPDRSDHVLKNDIQEDSPNHLEHMFKKDWTNYENRICKLCEAPPLRTEQYSWDYIITYPYVQGCHPTRVYQTDHTMYWKMTSWKTAQITLENMLKKRIKSLMEIWSASNLSTTLETKECSWDCIITHPYVYYHIYSDIVSDVLLYTPSCIIIHFIYIYIYIYLYIPRYTHASC